MESGPVVNRAQGLLPMVLCRNTHIKVCFLYSSLVRGLRIRRKYQLPLNRLNSCFAVQVLTVRVAHHRRLSIHQKEQRPHDLMMERAHLY